MVIQRWQSVMLLIATVMMTLFTFVTMAQFQTPLQTLNYSCLGFSAEGIATDGAQSGYVLYTWPLFIVSLLSAVLPFLAIFLYKKAAFQRSLCVIEVLFILLASGLAVWYGFYMIPDVSVRSWSALICAPVIALVAAVWARRLIGKDMALLRAADRIR